MPFANILKSALTISIGAILGYNVVKFFKPKENSRFIASYPASKYLIAKLDSEQVARSLFNIKINTDELALTEDGISTIKVSIEALINLANPNVSLTYHWSLPQDVDLVEGPLDDNLGALRVNQSKELLLRVRSFSKQHKKYISFKVSGQINHKPVNREVLISSRIEDSFEHRIQQNELRKPKNQINKLDNDKLKKKFSPDRIIH